MAGKAQLSATGIIICRSFLNACYIASIYPFYRTIYSRVSSASVRTVYMQVFSCCNGYEQSGSDNICLGKCTVIDSFGHFDKFC